MTSLCKQCRSRSVGFFRSQLIWICTVCHLVCEFILTTKIEQSDWLKIRSGHGILIYSASQGLSNLKYINEMTNSVNSDKTAQESGFIIAPDKALFSTKNCWSFSYFSTKTYAGLGGSFGCAVRLETRRLPVQPPPRSSTFFRGDWSWNIFYDHSLPSADSRRAVVSF